MHRRNIRLRREYLYRKSLEGKERLLYEKKRKIKEALEEGKPIPTELRNEEAALRKEIDLEDENTAVPRSTIDDEYANATGNDPKILLTTSRNPSAPLTQFVKVISEIIETCLAHDFTDVILVHEHRGVPDGTCLLVQLLTLDCSMWSLPLYMPEVVFCWLDILIMQLGERTVNILKHLFPVPKPDTKRIITFANQSDYISFRHHIYEKHGGPKSIELKEVGPRFELRLYQIKLRWIKTKLKLNGS
ncbi:hypothetical protein RND71_002491 [Anisodus tanguticus]|uniref:Brix domain-containing protein n=1 Tax=Anisodus tanguticus TaxID=243964 RepID=A0AAE1T2R4_9SOLA|nr:hypothetical protein RND71_002491 [Anisodus tanguticus]